MVVSHGTEPDPIFNYGNRVALDLWQLDWHTFTQTPSRHTVKPDEEPDRERLLIQARANGFIDNYEGIRIASTGQRFQIKNVILWNVLDEQGDRCGQAATFDQWQFINSGDSALD